MQTTLLQKLGFGALVLLLAAAIILPFLGVGEIYQVSEGREGVVVHAMLETGSYVLPLRHAEIVPSKPPLFHWIAAALTPMTSSDPELALRMPSALAAIAMVIALFWNLATLRGVRFGLLAALIMLTTNGFLRLSADGRVDMLFTFLATMAVIRWMVAYSRSQEVRVGETGIAGSLPPELPSSAYRELAVWTGLAVLGKGPLGIVLPLLVLGTAVVVLHGVRAVRIFFRKEWWWTFALSGPWYFLATLQGKSAFVGRQIFFENVGRFFGGEGISKKPPWFYLAEFWKHAMPWGFVLLAFGVLIVRARRRATLDEYLPADSSARTILRFALVWFVTPIVFFSLSSGKRAAYLLAVVPPMCIILSILLEATRERLGKFWTDRGSALVRRLSEVILGLFVVSCPLAVATYSGVATPLVGERRSLSNVIVALEEVLARDGRLFLVGVAVLSTVAISSLLIAGRRGSGRAFSVAAFSVLLLVLQVLTDVGQAVRGITHGYRVLADQVRSQVGPNEKLTFIKRKRDESFDGFFYYMNRTVLLFEPTVSEGAENIQPDEPGWYLARVGWIHAQPDRWTARVEQALVGGRMADTPEKQVMLFRLKPPPTDAPQPPQEPIPGAEVAPTSTPAPTEDFVLDEEG